jgi:hypothetical protein
MAAVGALSARPVLNGQSLRSSSKATAGRRVSTVVRAEGQGAYKPGINMAEGPADALNKWSRKITQPKSQGASQVRNATDIALSIHFDTTNIPLATSPLPR